MAVERAEPEPTSSLSPKSVLRSRTWSDTNATDLSECLSLILMIGNTYKEDLLNMGLEPLTVGFANLVWAAKANGIPVVLKRYTDLVFLRIDPDAIGVVDKFAWRHACGPKVLYSSPLGLVAQRVPGRTLEEKDMHKGDNTLLENVAHALHRFHHLPVPAQCKGIPMLWRTIDKMMNAILRRPDIVPKGMPAISVVQDAIRDSRRALEKRCPVEVLGHGDCKPSNVIADGHDITLIDFELSGPNYRGFDLMKIFRTAEAFSEPCLRHFLSAYAAASLAKASAKPGSEGAANGGYNGNGVAAAPQAVTTEMVDDLVEEAYMFEPLTWLEAAVFFLALPLFKGEDTDKWNNLAIDRWEKFLQTKHKLFGKQNPGGDADLPAEGLKRVESSLQLDLQALILAIGNNCKEDLQEMGMHPLTVGFANLVWAAEVRGMPVVLKRYTDLVFLRIDPEAIGFIDMCAWDYKAGPRVLYCSPLGLVAERVPGRTLEEVDMHKGDNKLLDNVAAALAKFHKLPVPEPCAGTPMLWRTIDKMMDAVVRRPDIVPKGMPSIEVISKELDEARAALEKHKAVIVLGHGDCKPSNVIVSGDHSENVTLIDFELSGPNYRGFDLMKIFRTAGSFSDDCVRRFMLAYAKSNGEEEDAAEATAEALIKEAHMFEPLTWLEAAVFFLALPMFKRQDTERWNTLAIDRWEKYVSTKHKLCGSAL
eukprot:TRINITY_DN4142_c0_g1_i1.p1 TRINITY_DN4142_c0_g1~~TRINITY_DN4142_c0_g1_i1.p1  ORF type:complete len:705 (+),score=190.93 TRINITY_DN4142_c0_g1_i1:57-2171(+)